MQKWLGQNWTIKTAPIKHTLVYPFWFLQNDICCYSINLASILSREFGPPSTANCPLPVVHNHVVHSILPSHCSLPLYQLPQCGYCDEHIKQKIECDVVIVCTTRQQWQLVHNCITGSVQSLRSQMFTLGHMLLQIVMLMLTGTQFYTGGFSN